jgi:ribosomal protein S18 acetylase RimI-like enzyme
MASDIRPERSKAHRLKRLRHEGLKPPVQSGDGPTPDAVLDCGWGRLLIGHTFPDPATLAQELLNEQPGERDIALYVAAPQQILGLEPTQLFLDPSDTLRLWFSALYEVLLGQSQGPRFGSFAAIFGLDRTVDLIERALAGELAR